MNGSLKAESLTLEPLRWWDIERVVQLERMLFPTDSPWSAEMFWAELAEGCHYVVFRTDDGSRDGRVDGYAGLALVGDDAEVRTIGVDPAMQGRGIGRHLLRDLISHAGGRRILLEVRTDNGPAQSLYESEGFVRIGVRRKYYEPSGADAYTMERA